MTIVLWLGIAFLAPVLAYLLFEDWLFLSRSRLRTKGTVFGHYRSTDDGSEYFSARIRFQTASGQPVEITDTFGSGSRRPPVGAVLDLVYPEGLPGRARVPRPLLRLLLYGIVGGLLGVLVALLAGVLP